VAISRPYAAAGGRDRPTDTLDQIDEKLVGFGFLNDAVNGNVAARSSPP